MRRFVFIVLLCLLPRASVAGDVIAGPVAATLVNVVDGDTLTLTAHIWISQTIEMKVRLLGIDAPELKGECEAERVKARAAKAYLGELVRGRTLTMREVRNDKYGGRALAKVEAAGRGDVATAMLARGLARPYDGGKRLRWCDVAQSGFHP
ncbi:MAG: thermonuclease family protein [Parvibaculaceae bacterium]